jgi:hypothetical protein
MRTFLQWFCGTYLVLMTLAVGICSKVMSDATAHAFGRELGSSIAGVLILLWLIGSFFGALVIFAYAIKAPPSSSRAPGASTLSPRSSR